MSGVAHIHILCVTVNKIAETVAINNHVRYSKTSTHFENQIVVECQLLELLDCTSVKKTTVQ